MRRLAFPALTGLLAACTTAGVWTDGTAVSPEAAYVLIQPHVAFGKYVPRQVDLQLTRIDKDGSLHGEYYPGVKNNAASIFKLAPGIYFLSRADADNARYKNALTRELTLFDARAGRLSYPGGWSVVWKEEFSSAEGTMAGGSTTNSYRIVATVEANPDIDRIVRTQYPSLAEKLTPVFSRIDRP
jgi:hypothetical protein